MWVQVGVGYMQLLLVPALICTHAGSAVNTYVPMVPTSGINLSLPTDILYVSMPRVTGDNLLKPSYRAVVKHSFYIKQLLAHNALSMLHTVIQVEPYLCRQGSLSVHQDVVGCAQDGGTAVRRQEPSAIPFPVQEQRGRTCDRRGGRTLW